MMNSYIYVNELMQSGERPPLDVRKPRPDFQNKLHHFWTQEIDPS